MSIWKQIVSELAAEDARKASAGDDSFDATLALLRDKKERLFRHLRRLADQTPMSDREWFRLSEIANYCGKLPGRFVVDQGERNRALESLRLAICSGAFCDQRGRSKIANLQSSPLATVRFDRRSAAMPEMFLKIEPELWIRREDCEEWLKIKDAGFPAEWKKAEQRNSRARGGRKPTFDKAIRAAVFELMEHHGDLMPGDSEWSIQADVEKAVSKELSRTGLEPVESTIRDYVRKFIEEWRQSRGR